MRFGLSMKSVYIAVFTIALLAVFEISYSGEMDYAGKRAERFAKTLIRDCHYNEAESFLKSEISNCSNQSVKIKLMFLLSEVYSESGDNASAREVLNKLKGIVSSGSAREDILKREKQLNKAKNLTPTIKSEITATSERASEADSLQRTGDYDTQYIITNSFFETDLRQVLMDLSLETGIPIIWDNTVEGLVTYEALDQPLETVLKAILLPVGYTYRYDDGTYIVGSIRPTDPAFELISETRIVTLSNIDAAEALKLLSEHFLPYVKASSIKNAICITAPGSIIERIEDDLALIDGPPTQVLIDVVVTEITTQALRKMGLDWSITKASGNPSWSVGTDHTDISNKTISGDYIDNAFDFGDYTVELLGALEAMVQTGEAQIRANPRLTTVNGNRAEIAITKDQYFVIQTSTSPSYNYNTLQSITSGIKLQITPFISSNGEITIKVIPEVGDVIGSGNEGLPEISVRSANTTVRVRDGETTTIGGLNFKTEKTIQNKIPLLGSIPILGYFFRYDEREVKDTQIVIFITPYILD
ncbi:MAG: hypothetical protein GF307_10010 [candidate division Zixibacteria bacterium]|nr:hypothetical protein [candidate division Zixibacteria bacterium]